MKKLLLCLGMVAFSQISMAQVALTESFESETFPPTGWTVENTHPTKNWARMGETTLTDFPPLTGTGSAYVMWDTPIASDESLITPGFSLLGYSSAYLNFSFYGSYTYMVAPNNNGDFTVSVSVNNGAWQEVWNEEDEDEATFDEGIIYKRIDISAIAAGQTNVKVKFNYTALDSDVVVLDDVSVTACAPISGLTLAALTSGGPSFTWEGSAAGYSIEYGPAGFTQGNGTGTVTTDTEAYEFTNLTAGQAYSFYFRSDCNFGATGAWDGPYTIGVPITTPATLPYSYDFEAFNNATAGWATLNGATGGVWGVYNGPEAFQYDGGNFAGAIGAGAVTNSWLFSRGLNLVGGSQITVSYWLRKADLGTGESINNNMTVTIGTDKTAAAQTTVIATHNGIEETEYTQQTFTYNVPTSGIYYLGFHATTGIQTAATAGGILLDAVSVTGETAGTKDFASQLSVFPNPATNVINVANNNGILVNGIQITDLNGRTVKTVKFAGVTEAQVNISDLASGMYLMTVSSDKGTMTQKIVKN